MKILFDARSDSDFNWLGINEDLKIENPSYIEKFGKVGSHSWWSAYDKGLFKGVKTTLGTVTFVGEETDDFNEISDIIKIQDNDGNEVVYDKVGYWDAPEVVIGTKVKIESITILVSNRLGPHIYEIDMRVEVQAN